MGGTGKTMERGERGEGVRDEYLIVNRGRFD